MPDRGASDPSMVGPGVCVGGGIARFYACMGLLVVTTRVAGDHWCVRRTLRTRVGPMHSLSHPRQEKPTPQALASFTGMVTGGPHKDPRTCPMTARA